MIPGKSSDYDGWSMQYHGYLINGNYALKSASPYIISCLDQHPEILQADNLLSCCEPEYLNMNRLTNIHL